MWIEVIGIGCGVIFVAAIAAIGHAHNMREHRCGTISGEWTLAPCIKLHCKAIHAWIDYMMHYPIITDREDYVGRWVVCKGVWHTYGQGTGKVNRWGFHKAGECPHSMYMTPDERRAERRKAQRNKLEG